MHNRKILSSAEKDLQKAVLYYLEKDELLAIRFLNDFEETVNDISRWEEAWPLLTGSYRKHLMKQFPYAIFFRSEKDNILIYYVVHCKRDHREIIQDMINEPED